MPEPDPHLASLAALAPRGLHRSLPSQPTPVPARAPCCAPQGAKPVPFLAAVGIGLALRFLVPIPVGITVQAWTLLSIFVSTIAGEGGVGGGWRLVVGAGWGCSERWLGQRATNARPVQMGGAGVPACLCAPVPFSSEPSLCVPSAVLLVLPSAAHVPKN